MNAVKKNKLVTLLLLITLSIFLNSCKKDNNQINPVTPTSNSFSFGSTAYNVTWKSFTDVGSGGPLGYIDVAATNSTSYLFAVYNMPMQSGGTYSFTNGIANVGGSQLYALATLGTPPDNYTSTGGSVTKTGANSFTFSCIMVGYNSSQITVTGQGTY